MVWLFLLGCPSEPEPEPPTLEILSPAEGAQVGVTDVQVSFVAEHFTLVEPGSAALRAPAPSPFFWIPTAAAHGDEEDPEGYASVRIDGTEVGQASETQFTIDTLEAGSHTLEIELVWPDGDSLDPAVRASVAFEAVAP